MVLRIPQLGEYLLVDTGDSPKTTPILPRVLGVQPPQARTIPTLKRRSTKNGVMRKAEDPKSALGPNLVTEHVVGARRKQMDESTLPPWRCRHRCPIVVIATEGGGKRAQCLGCKGFGPEGEVAEQARQRLLAADPYSLGLEAIERRQ